MADNADAETLARLLRTRRSVRDFTDREVPAELIAAILDDARWAPSWSNTQPYKIAVAGGALKDQAQGAVAGPLRCRGEAAGRRLARQARGLPHAQQGPARRRLRYAFRVSRRNSRRAAARPASGCMPLSALARGDTAARHRQMRRNWEFFGAPVVLFVFVRRELGAYSVLDAGIFLQSLMLSAQARGLGTCAEGALGTWAGPVREAFDVPPAYKLLCGLALGWPSDHVVNAYNPGRADVAEMLIPQKRS
jgi:nitroreductase